MRTLFVPSTAPGRWATALLLLFVLLMTGKFALAGSIPVSVFAIFGIGLVAGVLALFAVLRKRERSLWAFLAIIVGLLLAIWTAGEILYPH